MISRRFLPVAVILLALSASLFAQAKHPKKKAGKAKPTPVVEPAAVIPEATVAPAPLTLAQKPAVPPKIQYQNGQLSILAENCVLGDILRAVHQQTGAVVDLPSNVTERVVVNLGPGPSRDVLAKLLNGSNYNYMMLGSPTDANDVRHLIVTSKSGGDIETAANNQPQPGFNGRTPLHPPPQNAPMISGGEPDNGAENEPEDNTADDQPQPEEQPAAEGQPADQTGQPGQGIKTPEQLLQELQRQQQMQQQQQQQQSAPQGFPPPPQNQPEQ